MAIEWCRVLSIIILAAILFIRLYRTAKVALDEVKITFILAHETAAMIRQGVKPAFVLLALIQWVSPRCEHADTGSGRHRR